MRSHMIGVKIVGLRDPAFRRTSACQDHVMMIGELTPGKMLVVSQQTMILQ